MAAALALAAASDSRLARWAASSAACLSERTLISLAAASTALAASALAASARPRATSASLRTASASRSARALVGGEG